MDDNLREARKLMYQKLLKDNPEGDRQMMKQLAYDVTRQAVESLNEAAKRAEAYPMEITVY
jgi:hypothetical protein